MGSPCWSFIHIVNHYQKTTLFEEREETKYAGINTSNFIIIKSDFCKT